MRVSSPPLPRSLRILSLAATEDGALTHSLQVLLLLAVIIAAAKARRSARRSHSSARGVRRDSRRRHSRPDRLQHARVADVCRAARRGSIGITSAARRRSRSRADWRAAPDVRRRSRDRSRADATRRHGRVLVGIWRCRSAVHRRGGARVAFGLPLFWQGIYIGTILTATSVSISAQTLMELGALRSREGSTILAAAVIDDVMGIVVLSIVVALSKASLSGGVDGAALAIVVLRLVVVFRSRHLRRAMAADRASLGIGAPRKSGDARGRSRRLRSSMAGRRSTSAAWPPSPEPIWRACSSRRRSSRQSIDSGVHALTYAMFVPVFFISIGLQADARALGRSGSVCDLSDPRRDRDQGDRLRCLVAAVWLRQPRVGSCRHRHDLAR